ncbi:hypothetical protein N7493_009383 [Penicillium malachiteum]|uniref:Uncharacterized protein n=1 Tax=Penicillium malachiteum TaxID=1324776 RepID=A0AAD6HEU2_9EURO|nr:hypothetical protein N7493_009383 [Penicillium malachiteum]
MPASVPKRFLGPGWLHDTPGYKAPRGALHSRGLRPAAQTDAGPPPGEVHRPESRLNPGSESGRKRFPFNNFTSCIPKQLDSSKELHMDADTVPDGILTSLPMARSRALRRGPHLKHPLQITTRTPKGPDFKFELLPLHSPLLRQSLLVSFPPLIDMLKFSGYPYLIRGQPAKKIGLRG